MAVFEQGGGGGRVLPDGSLGGVGNDDFAIAPPDLSWPPTQEQWAALQEFLSILGKNTSQNIASPRLLGRYASGYGPPQAITVGSRLSLSSTGVLSADVQASTGGLPSGYNLFAVSGTLSSAQLDTLNATPVTIASAPGTNKLIVPLEILIVTKIPSGSTWSNGPTYNMKYTGAGVNLNLFATLPSNLNRSGPATTVAYNTGFSWAQLTSQQSINKGIDLQFSLDAVPSGSSTATADYWFSYWVVDSVTQAS